MKKSAFLHDGYLSLYLQFQIHDRYFVVVQTAAHRHSIPEWEGDAETSCDRQQRECRGQVHIHTSKHIVLMFYIQAIVHP